MPIYEYRCLECGEVFSHLFLRSTDAAGQIQCSACGCDQTRRLISSFAIGGKADPGPGRAAWPTSWSDTNGGDPETLRYWRKRIEREARLEEKYPELRDRSPQTGRGEEAAPAVTEHTHGHSHDEHHHHHHGHATETASGNSEHA
ncbi:MAG TPA: zinc ribbon domain-containing protein [Ktedonobacteraceae bacterium]